MATTNERLLVGTRKGVLEVRKNGGTWSFAAPRLAGQPIAYAVFDPRTNAEWASIDHGHWGVKLARRENGGEYVEVDPPKYPAATGKAARYYWVLQPGHASTPDTFYVGTEPGGLFVTHDGGASWSFDEALWALCVEHGWQGGGRDDAGIHSICVDPRDASHVYVGISCAGVLETKDGGGSWDYVNQGCTKVFDAPEMAALPYGFDPHFVAMSPTDPDVLWQQNHCGVFRSTDGAATWTDLSQKPLVHFGFPVAVHPLKPGTAWVIPMKSDEERTAIDGALCVMRSDDGGASWTEQRGGLPQAGSFDFPYRHAFDVGADGDTLAFGTTSGNLYVSEDGGASWQTVSSNLPLIYSVRFA